MSRLSVRLSLALVLGAVWASAAAQTTAPARAPDRFGARTWTTSDGLPQNTVTAVTQTPEGYLWLGTFDGLARFDGLRFTVFNDRDVPALRSSRVSELLATTDGTLWIGTEGGGVVRYRGGAFEALEAAPGSRDRLVLALAEGSEGTVWVGYDGGGLGRVEGDRVVPADAPALEGESVWALAAGPDGRLWIGTDRGLMVLQGGRLRAFGQAAGLGSESVRALAVDAAGTLWVGTRGGLSRRLPTRPATFETFRVRDGLPNEVVWRLLATPDGALWVGTFGGGLARLTLDVGSARPRFERVDGLPSPFVRALFRDREGNVWAGTGQGLARFRRSLLTTYLEGLPTQPVRSVAQGRDGAVWIGTFGGGLARLQGGRYTVYDERHGLPSRLVWSVLETRDGTVWAGTSGGLARRPPGRSGFEPAQFGAATDSLLRYSVRALYQPPGEGLWVGTNGGGLLYLDGDAVRAYGPEDGLPDATVSCVLRDRAGALWACTNGHGLARLAPGADRFVVLDRSDGLPHDVIRALYEDADGALWVGTYGGGLVRIKDGAMAVITTAHGLFDSVVHFIAEDAHGDVWMSSNRGLFRASREALDAVAEGRRSRIRCTPYGTAEGMESAEGNGGSQPAGWLAPDGRLWFPTMAGAVVLDPADVPRDPPPPPVLVAGLSVDGGPLQPAPEAREDARPAVRRVPAGATRLELAYAGLALGAPEQVRYRYRLEGYDAGWVEAGSNREATYTNLGPGRYTFLVQASQGGGPWSVRPARYAFAIAPRFYQTGLFYLGLMGALALGGWGAVQARARRRKAREDELRALVEERTERLAAAMRHTQAQADALAEMAAGRSRLIANLSHELRTPLTLLIAPLEDAVVAAERAGQPTGPQRHMLRNARLLLALTEDLLALTQAESGALALRPRPGDLVGALRDEGEAVLPFLTPKGVTLRFRAPARRLPARFDPGALSKMVGNLLSNAAKFTPPGGHVVLALKRGTPHDPEGEGVTLVVEDSGGGVEPGARERVFERFYQTEAGAEAGGTGIGLSLVKALAEQHGGGAWVEASAEGGGRFVLALPLERLPGAEGSPLDEILEGDAERAPHPPAGDGLADAAPALVPPDAPHVLVVDDNADIRALLRDQLGAARITEAADAQTALQLARELLPDLVISDVTMPGGSGVELCRSLKSAPRTAGLPVVLLTARTGAEAEREGLDAGADDYLTKPFSPDVLRARVHGLVGSRRHLHERYASGTDADFLARALDVVGAHLGDASFSVEHFAAALALSPRQLRRRLKAAAGESPAAFVRNVRLERARALLQARAAPVSEIAYRTGFNDPAYFARRFREAYGVAPSAYAEAADADAG